MPNGENLKICVIGTRGIPLIQGGVETHCEELYPRIADMGHEVILMRRDCYVEESNRISEFRGVKLIDVSTPRRKSLEAIVHTARALMKARRLRPDIVHIHAIGPSLLTPMAKMLGMKVVTTHHGPDYDRQKWGWLAKQTLRAGERMGALFSDRVIVISKVIERMLHSKYRKVRTSLIYNGVPGESRTEAHDYIDSLGLQHGRYVVALGRFVKEKNFHQLIEAFPEECGFKLVIAGDADHPDDYSRYLKDLAAGRGVTLTGFIKGEKLRQLMSGAALFVLPSSHEGLPISLLEAMGYGLDVLVSDIPANSIPELSPEDFFRTNDTADLSAAIRRKLSSPTRRSYDLSNYNWDNIARQTERVYREVAWER